MHTMLPALSIAREGDRDPRPGQHGSGSGSGSATKMLSSSSLQVMLAVSSLSCAKRNPTCPERKSKTPFLLKDCLNFEFKFKECEKAVLCLYLINF